MQTVVVPGVHVCPAMAEGRLPDDLAAALREAAGHARMLSICTGAFVLAAAGLLDGHPATAHWMHAATFRRLGASGYLARTVRRLDETTAATASTDPLATLTTRERQVAHALATGMTNKEIAEHLYVSVTTVNFHVRNILAKLGLRSRRELRALSRRRPVKS